MNQNLLSDVIYENIITWIYSGNLQKGDSLPTLEKLCTQYNTGRNTIRTVLKRLSDSGYISVSRGKPSILLFDFAHCEQFDGYYTDLCARKTALLNTMDLFNLGISEFYRYCIPLQTPETLHSLKEIQYNLTEEADSAAQKFPSILRQANRILYSPLKNELLDDLLSFIHQYIGFPLPSYIQQSKEYTDLIHQFCDLLDTIGYALEQPQSKPLTLAKAKAFYTAYTTVLTRFLNSLKSGTVNKLPWYLRPYQHYSYIYVVYSILLRISTQVTHLGEFLPSYGTLADEYNVSVKTVEKSIGFLNECGILKTINGVGSKVADPIIPHINDMATLPFGENLATVYLCTIQLAILISIPLLSEALQYLSADQLKELGQTYRTDRSNSFFSIFSSLIEAIPNSALHHIFQQLSHCFIWSLCIDIMSRKGPYFELIRIQQKKILEKMQNANIHGLPEDMQMLLIMRFYEARYYLSDLCPELLNPNDFF